MKKTCPFAGMRKYRWIGVLLLLAVVTSGVLYQLKVRAQRPAEGDPSESILDVTADTLNIYLTKGKPIVLEFYTKFCPYCARMEDELSELNAKYGDKILVLKMNAEMYPDTASAYKIQGVPTLVLFDAEGTVKETSPGYREYSEIEKLLMDLGLIE
ncbi:MAG: thioredoxin family protein [Firmicutes bacterium]|nr:thioredoxin family protein [Candidatus Fermentithermobacillaceae bacterium]HRC53306.1 thioredoxin family protein [Bacillota bacterium]